MAYSPPSLIRNLLNTTAIAAGIFLLGLALRLYCLDCHGFWYDEIESLAGAQLGIPGLFTDRSGFLSNQTPLHYLLVWLTAQPIDPTTTTVLARLPSALAGALTLPVVYGLGKDLFGAAQGLVALFLLTLAPIHLNYSQDLRPYSMLVLLTALSVYTLLLADRTQSPLLWIAFASATIANLLNAYVALSLAMPALAPYMVWMLWKQWSQRQENPRALIYALASFAAVSLASVLVLLDTLQTPRLSPDLSLYSPQVIVGSILELMTWFTQFAINAQIERLAQLLLLILSLVGLFLALRFQPEAAALCTLFIVVPPVVLSILGTTNAIFQRYALFSMPFYFLLIGHALVWLLQGAVQMSRTRSAATGNLLKIVAVAIAGVFILPFLVGQYNYYTYGGHIALSYRPDFRSVASYLSSQARGQDLVIFIDDPALGYSVTNYYWKGKPPAPNYDARDPRLFAESLKGDIYWIVSSEKLNSELPRIASPSHGWSAISSFERVVVLRESNPTGGIAGSLDRMVRIWEGLLPDFQSVLTLRGSVYQGRGDIAQATATYRRAGTYFPVGNDFLQTAIGYDARNDNLNAWREALISKFLEPQRAQVHMWLARKLSSEGYSSESRIEEAIAEALEGKK